MGFVLTFRGALLLHVWAMPPKVSNGAQKLSWRFPGETLSFQFPALWAMRMPMDPRILSQLSWSACPESIFPDSSRPRRMRDRQHRDNLGAMLNATEQCGRGAT